MLSPEPTVGSVYLLLRVLKTAEGRLFAAESTKGVDVRANLADAEGRQRLVEEVGRLAPASIDGLVLVAGIGAAAAATVKVNYFGTLAVLTGLQPLLLKSDNPQVVAVLSASLSASSLSSGDSRVIRACLHGDESTASAVAERAISRGRGGVLYRSSKMALNRWVRRFATHRDWAGHGILLNVVALGIVDTATVRESILKDSIQTRVLRLALPQPLAFPGTADAIADASAWLVSAENSFMTGQIIFIDGGADATLRSDRPCANGSRYGLSTIAKKMFWLLLGRAHRHRSK